MIYLAFIKAFDVVSGGISSRWRGQAALAGGRGRPGAHGERGGIAPLLSPGDPAPWPPAGGWWPEPLQPPGGHHHLHVPSATLWLRGHVLGASAASPSAPHFGGCRGSCAARCIRSSARSSISPSCCLLSPRSLASPRTSLPPPPAARANPLICAQQRFPAWHGGCSSQAQTAAICIPPLPNPGSLISSRYQVSQAPPTSDKPMFRFVLFPFYLRACNYRSSHRTPGCLARAAAERAPAWRAALEHSTLPEAPGRPGAAGDAPG